MIVLAVLLFAACTDQRPAAGVILDTRVVNAHVRSDIAAGMQSAGLRYYIAACGDDEGLLCAAEFLAQKKCRFVYMAASAEWVALAAAAYPSLSFAVFDLPGAAVRGETRRNVRVLSLQGLCVANRVLAPGDAVPDTAALLPRMQAADRDEVDYGVVRLRGMPVAAGRRVLLPDYADLFRRLAERPDAAHAARLIESDLNR